MLEFYWILFITGIILTIVIVLFGEILDGWLDGMFEFLSLEGPEFIHPVTIVGGITAFGGSGILFSRFGFGTIPTISLALLIAVALSTFVYFVYVKPMRASENSLAFSREDLVGQLGEVTVSIPAQGFGEVMIRMGTSHVTEIAASYEQCDIPLGTRVVVVENKDGVTYVSAFEQ